LAGFKEYVKGMSVAWFSFNIATSAIVLASYAIGNLERLSGLISLARALAVFNTATYILTAILYSIRVALDWRGFVSQLKHPATGPFMAVISIATMLLALDWSLVLGHAGVAAGFFYAGLILHTALFIAVMYYLERHPGIEVHYMNPGWYMPAVGNVLVPYVGMILSSMGIHIPRSFQAIYLGTGTVMWLALFSIWLYRSIFYHPPPARVMAINWVNIAPPAVIPLSYEALLGFTPKVYAEMLRIAVKSPVSPLALKLLTSFYDMFYYTFWGAAGLLFALVIVVTIGYIARREVEFAESWWAFTFPLAAYTISTIHLYLHHLDEGWLRYYIWALYLLTWASYLVTSLFTVYYGYEELVRKMPVEKLPPAARPLPEEALDHEAMVSSSKTEARTRREGRERRGMASEEGS
jgi:tellurite resistance protein